MHFPYGVTSVASSVEPLIHIHEIIFIFAHFQATKMYVVQFVF